MMNFLPALLALIIGASIAVIELITSQYPRTAFLLKKSWSLYTYAVIYGIISFTVMFGIKALGNSGRISLDGFGISNEWIQSILLGLSTKAFLHIRLFNVNVGSQSFPIGIETIVYMFEPWLLRTTQLDEFNAVREYIDVARKNHDNLGEVKQRIKENIPSNLIKNDRGAFMTDLSEKTTVAEAMELYLESFGRRSFERVFLV